MTLEELQRKVYGLLRERLQQGKMEPFYTINGNFWNWMHRHGVKWIKSGSEWYGKYGGEGSPIRDGYFGLIYMADVKIVTRRSPKRTRATFRPNGFHLELPIDLVEKALALGFFP
jgi:hypothetical protein